MLLCIDVCVMFDFWFDVVFDYVKESCSVVVDCLGCVVFVVGMVDLCGVVVGMCFGIDV